MKAPSSSGCIKGAPGQYESVSCPITDAFDLPAVKRFCQCFLAHSQHSRLGRPQQEAMLG